MDEFSEYSSRQQKNREVFRKNFVSDTESFKEALTTLRNIWGRLGIERDKAGQSHAGLLPFSNILVRHVIFGFEHLACYQSFLAWLTFRPGLEALLMLGKFVDDPANAKIWLNREVDVNSYRRTFEGKALESTSLPLSPEFRQVLSRLNTEFMHPNPVFAYRDATIRSDAGGMLVEIQFFDVDADVHEGHLLAYSNLIDAIVRSSKTVVDRLCGSKVEGGWTGNYAVQERGRALKIAARNAVAKKVMEELGLWNL
jgi:hypothetical protein